MNNQCVKCQANFEITDEDLAFYDKVSPVFNGVKQQVPAPTHCPACRLQRRLVNRNQGYIYYRTIDDTGKKSYSGWPPDVPFPVYENEYYYGSDWDAITYGRDFNATQSVFAQMHELSKEVPRPARSVLNVENSEYCNNGDYMKNCYLMFGAIDVEDCMSSEICWYGRDLLECTQSYHCELCYECIACEGCYNVQSSFHAENCRDSYFLMNCRNCEHCFGCVNLRNAKFQMFNEQLSEEEYFSRINELNLSSYSQRAVIYKRCLDFWQTHPRPHALNTNSENVTGDMIQNSKDVHESFFVSAGESMRHCYYVVANAKDCMDHSVFGNNVELTYESSVCGNNSSNLLFCESCWNGCNNLMYCRYCFQSKDCFGCVGLNYKQYCIFNKQYSKEEYETLVPKIIEKMRTDGDWGEYFNANTCYIPYNKSHSYRLFPLSKDDALSQGLQWQEQDATSVLGDQEIDDYVDTYPENKDSMILTCKQSGKPFRLTSTEISRYKKFNAPLPRMTYNNRFDERFDKIGKPKLYDRTCDKTGKAIKTTIPPDSGWIVWDKDVYEQEFSG